MNKVFAARNSTEAHLVKGLLEREGIAAEVHEWLATAIGEIPVTPDTWPSVWILKDDQLGRALKFVAGYESSHKKTG